MAINEIKLSELYPREYLDQHLSKAGAGSKGGKIIGYTKSGKAIYKHNNSQFHSEHYSKFSEQEHREASEAHAKVGNKRAASAHTDYANQMKKKTEYDPSEGESYHGHDEHKEANGPHYSGGQEIKKAITLEDYQDPTTGNNPYLIKGFVNNEIPTEDEFRKALDDKLEKGLIDKELHAKAIEQLESLMAKGHLVHPDGSINTGKKKSGEGSKGGHVIGHTKSGKPVYAGKKASDYKEFSAQDHLDAAEYHNTKSVEHNNKRGSADYSNDNVLLENHHNQTRNAHGFEAAKIVHTEQKNNLSSDEKKILADQKKKQIEHHVKMHKFHNEMADQSSRVSGFENGNYHDKATNDEMYKVIEHHKLQSDHHKSEKERLEKE